MPFLTEDSALQMSCSVQAVGGGQRENGKKQKWRMQRKTEKGWGGALSPNLSLHLAH